MKLFSSSYHFMPTPVTLCHSLSHYTTLCHIMLPLSLILFSFFVVISSHFLWLGVFKDSKVTCSFLIYTEAVEQVLSHISFSRLNKLVIKQCVRSEAKCWFCLFKVRLGSCEENFILVYIPKRVMRLTF